MTDLQYMIDVMAAAKRGARIQRRWTNSIQQEPWHDIFHAPEWNWRDADYRIAPEPRKARELTMTFTREGDIERWSIRYDKDRDTEFANAGTVRFREVIEPAE